MLSLFSGVGGLDLGLELAGLTTVGQVEIDPFCRRVLARHWPEVPRHDDVRTCVAWWRSTPRSRVDVVAGGFPCQGHSVAGRRRGTGDERWGWPWFRDVVAALEPPLVVVENVPGLLRTGLVDVLRDLADLRFDAWWNRVPAAALGAPHLRWRLVLVAAHADRVELRSRPGWEFVERSDQTVTGHDGATWSLADPDGATGITTRCAVTGSRVATVARRSLQPGGRSSDDEPWSTEPSVDRVAHGIPDRVDRLRVLGNAVVPAVGEYVGNWLRAEVGEIY